MGTPDFAIPSLDILLKAGYPLELVTAPDRHAGRGQQIRISPVKEYALSRKLPLHQPEKLREQAFVNTLLKYDPHLIVVVAFRMLPEVVWKLPSFGTINLHASLLPQYRGAAPIHWAVINGETGTGLTTFFINQEIDKGDILFKEEVPISEDMDSGQLHDEMKEKGASLLLKTVDAIRTKAVNAIPQYEKSDLTTLRTAPKITRQHCQIDWNRPATAIHNQVRGLRPYPGAFTLVHLASGKHLEMKVWKGEVDGVKPTAEPGFLSVEGHTMRVSCKDACFKIQEVQLAGKQRMTAEAFLRGTSLPEQQLCLTP